MVAKHPSDDNLDAFMAKWEEGLQALSESLSKERENALQAGESDDLAAFMAKWETELQALYAEAVGEYAAAEEKRQDQPTPATAKIPAHKRGGRRHAPIIPKKPCSFADISPMQAATIMGMVEKVLLKAQKSTKPLLSLGLEVNLGKFANSFMIPVTLKNLYQGMVVLQVDDLNFIKNPEDLQGQKAILRLQGPSGQESLSITGTMTWKESTLDRKIHINLKMQSAQRVKQASKMLEQALPAASQDSIQLWNLWDKTQAIRESASINRNNFYLMLVAFGTIASSFIDPVLFQSMRGLLSGLAILKIKYMIVE